MIRVISLTQRRGQQTGNDNSASRHKILVFQTGKHDPFLYLGASRSRSQQSLISCMKAADTPDFIRCRCLIHSCRTCQPSMSEATDVGKEISSPSLVMLYSDDDLTKPFVVRSVSMTADLCLSGGRHLSRCMMTRV